MSKSIDDDFPTYFSNNYVSTVNKLYSNKILYSKQVIYMNKHDIIKDIEKYIIEI